MTSTAYMVGSASPSPSHTHSRSMMMMECDGRSVLTQQNCDSSTACVIGLLNGADIVPMVDEVWMQMLIYLHTQRPIRRPCDFLTFIRHFECFVCVFSSSLSLSSWSSLTSTEAPRPLVVLLFSRTVFTLSNTNKVFILSTIKNVLDDVSMCTENVEKKSFVWSMQHVPFQFQWMNERYMERKRETKTPWSECK